MENTFELLTNIFYLHFDNHLVKWMNFSPQSLVEEELFNLWNNTWKEIGLNLQLYLLKLKRYLPFSETKDEREWNTV